MNHKILAFKDDRVASEKINIGSYIRKLRKLQQRTLQDVANQCGYTKSLLSKIENGRVIPPVSTMVKIASALNTTVAALMERGNIVDCVYTPASQQDLMAVATESGYCITPLAVEFKKKRMQPFFSTIKAEDLNDKVNSHLGEEFIYILKGSMEFQVGEKKYILRPGDSLFFNSIEDHLILRVLSKEISYLNVFN